MPDKWEYPWFAAWDLAFHCAPLVARRRRLRQAAGRAAAARRAITHPNGQIPAYEWNFSDVNPPVTPWAALFVYEREARDPRQGRPRVFLGRVFAPPHDANFTWWVNRKDADDRNLFQGGFLGLDNIGVFDRSAPLPGGGTLDQADGTAWMALLLPMDAADRARTAPRTTPSTSTGAEVRSRTSRGSRRDEPRPARTGSTCGTSRTASTTTCCGCPDGSGIRSRFAPRRAACRWRGDGARRLLSRAIPGDHRRCSGVPAAHSCGRVPRWQLPADSRGRRAPAAVRAVRRGPAAPDPGGHARRVRVPRPARHPRHCRGATSEHPFVFDRGRPGAPGRLPAGRVGQRDVRRQLQLAWTGVGADQRHVDPGVAATCTRTTATTSRSSARRARAGS